MSIPLNETVVIEESGEGPKGLPGVHPIHVTIGVQVVICILGVVMNPLVLYFYKRREAKFTYTIAILGLAWKDILSCTIILPMAIIFEIVMFKIYDDFFCRMFHYLEDVGVFYTNIMLLAMALERCLCVCHSHRHRTRTTLMTIIVIALLIMSTIKSVPVALIMGVYSKIQPNSTAPFAVNVGYCFASNLVMPFEAFKQFVDFVRHEMIISGGLQIVCYLIMFAFVIYRAHAPSANDPHDQSHLQQRGTESPVDESEHSTSDIPEISDVASTDLIDREQNRWALIYFVITCTYWVFHLPVILMVFRQIPRSIVFISFHQLHFFSNPIILFIMDTAFRAEVIDLIKTQRYQMFGINN